ncbi:uncharacterized protein LOC125839459 [Solanum verrucosum]|uniref:uncharacterized protein LOC125839459 n=1 Tax=Solanum verrucosum TaxID=315347 RepID=UPI0020D1279C|nr:uncharacterized protein LOC125839459 [Solanum verrucosum]
MDPAASEEQSLVTEQLVEKQSFEPDCQGNVLKENDDEEIVFVNEEEDDDYEDDIDKEDVAQEVEDDILEGARHSYEQSNSDKIWPAELLLEHKENNVKEEEEGIEELFRVENCNLKSTQNDVAINAQQNYDGIDSYRTKFMYLDDIAAITRRRRVLLGALLVLIWYFVLKGILPPVIGGSRF